MKRFGIQNDIIDLGSYYGLEYYTHITGEECSELIQALNKLWRHNHNKEYEGKKEELLNHIYEEMADVEVCISTLKNLLHCEDEVYSWKQSKIKRQITRMKQG